MASYKRSLAQLGVPLFDLDTFEVGHLVIEAAKPAANVVVYAAPVAKTDILVEDLHHTSMSAYVIDSEDGDRVYLRSGYEISAWELVAEVALSYGIRLPDGRLCQYVAGSSRRLFSDSDHLRRARRAMGESRRRQILQEAV